MGEHTCLIRVTSIAQRGRKLNHLVDVSGEDSHKIANILAVPRTRTSLHLISSVGHVDEIETQGCPLYDVLSSTSCFLIEEVVRRDYLEWNVVGGSLGAINALTRELRKSGIEARNINIEKINGARKLTARQEQVLKLAYEKGFFDSPHKTDVRQLAKALDCSPSTLVRLLRKAEKKTIGDKLRVYGA